MVIYYYYIMHNKNYITSGSKYNYFPLFKKNYKKNNARYTQINRYKRNANMSNLIGVKNNIINKKIYFLPIRDEKSEAVAI